MAMSKAGGIAFALAMLGLGTWQLVHGVQECNGKRELTWTETRAKAIDIGDFTIKIPDGWRDASEADNPKLKSLLATQPGAHALVREDFDGQIVFIKSGPTEPMSDKPPCEQLAVALAKNESSTASNISQQTYGTDPGCRWMARRDDVEMTYNMRFHGPQVLVIACSGNGALCEPTLAGVALKK